MSLLSFRKPEKNFYSLLPSFPDWTNLKVLKLFSFPKTTVGKLEKFSLDYANKHPSIISATPCRRTILHIFSHKALRKTQINCFYQVNSGIACLTCRLNFMHPLTYPSKYPHTLTPIPVHTYPHKIRGHGTLIQGQT